MSRIAPQLGIPPKMYRHFAVVTLLLTACIALFADGERREAIENELAAQKKQAELQQQDADRAKQHQLAVATINRRGEGGWGSDAVVDPQGAGASGSEGLISDASNPGSYVNASTADMGVLRLPAMAQIQSGMPTGTMTGPLQKAARPKPTDADLKRLQRMSDMRAGAPTPPPVG